MRTKLSCGVNVGMAILLTTLAAHSGVAEPMESLIQEAPDGDAIRNLETFLLTPIVMETVAMEVPARVYGPTTNNSCQDWTARREACYLPARVLGSRCGDAAPGLDALIERHLSAWVGAWSPGAWPASGGSLTFALKQYASIEHLWMATRLEVSEAVGACYYRPGENLVRKFEEAAQDSAATLKIEVFDGIRHAPGYPRRTPR